MASSVVGGSPAGTFADCPLRIPREDGTSHTICEWVQPSPLASDALSLKLTLALDYVPALGVF